METNPRLPDLSQNLENRAEPHHELMLEDDLPRQSAALVFSGGVESAVLADALMRNFKRVHPLYVKFGLHWERAEFWHAKRYLQAIAMPGLQELTVLHVPADDIYDKHWSLSGIDVPDWTTADEAVELPGRNLLFTSKAAVWCSINKTNVLVFGTLGANPFPDASKEFFARMQQAISLAIETPFFIARPFSNLKKTEVIKMGAHLPLHLSFSCINPQPRHGTELADFIHCGTCNKCEERRHAFQKSGVPDKTVYAISRLNGTTSAQLEEHSQTAERHVAPEAGRRAVEQYAAIAESVPRPKSGASAGDTGASTIIETSATTKAGSI